MTDDEIEAVARKMCIELGLDPEQMVNHGFDADMTPSERATLGDAVPSMLCNSPQWRVWRYEAAIAIAAHRSIQVFIEII